MTFQFLILFFNPQYQCTTQDDADVNFSSATGGGYCGSGLVVADQVLGDHAATYDGGSCGFGGFLLPEVSILYYASLLFMLITSSSASTHSTSCTISFFYKHNMFRLWQSNMVTWWK